MSGRKDFNGLSDKLRKKPGAAAKIDRYRREMRDTLALAALREARGATQVEVADALGVTQPNVSRIEHQEDVYVSSLRSYVAALGGALELRAVFPDEIVVLSESE